MIRADSSFSRCSGVSAFSAARGEAANKPTKRVMTAGVKVLGNLLCRAEIIYKRQLLGLIT